MEISHYYYNALICANLLKINKQYQEYITSYFLAKISHYFQNIGIISDPVKHFVLSTIQPGQTELTWKRVRFG